MNPNPLLPTLTEASIRATLTEVYDPEFGISVEDMGLIYEARIAENRVTIAMTLTSMHCPAGQMMLDGVRAAIEALPEVAAVNVDLVWEPVWTPDLLSAKARRQLGIEDSVAG